MSENTKGDKKSYLILGSLFVIVIVSINAFSAIWPRSQEKFFELGLLNNDLKAEEFFPISVLNPNDPYLVFSNVMPLEELVNWNIFLKNHMGSEQLVMIRVKFIGSDPYEKIPDDSSHKPSNVRSSYNMTIPLLSEQSTIIPFVWSVTKIAYASANDLKNDYDELRRLTINGENVILYCRSYDWSFRVVFELWVWDSVSRDFRYGWDSGKEFLSASVYIWFKTRYL